MASPARSFFGSVKDKLSRKSRSPSPNPFRPRPTDAALSDGRTPAPFTKAAPPVDGETPPPPYSEVAPPTITVEPAARAPSPAPSASSALSDRSITSPEDPYAFLSSFDTIFLIDDSASMAGRSWREVRDALRAIAPICTAHDDNGIDLYFLNHRPKKGDGYCNIRSPDEVADLFASVQPSGGTPTGTRIAQILGPYLRDYEEQVARTGDPDKSGMKPVNMIVITDGAPTDDPESAIVRLARKLDRLDAPPHQLGIQFFQVGNQRGAAEALRELDDSLAEQADVRDMVDTVTFDATRGAARALSADAILKVVLGAVVRRLDRRRVGADARRSRDRLAP